MPPQCSQGLIQFFFGFSNQDMVLVGFFGMVRVHLGDVLYGNVKFLK